MLFPNVDPIPIPAPVWLMKALSLVTLALHFAAVMMLVGSLVLIIWHGWRGRQAKSPHQVSAGFVISRRLPVLMTFVINLGVPPLLFAQVLYGRAIYTSSVLIGVIWFSVILLLMLDYWLLYRIQAWFEAGKAAWVPALGALLVTLSVGHIYAMNMTLMLRPEVWQEMYARSPIGMQGVTGDPTMMPRWLFVMAGGPIFGGLYAVLISHMKHLEPEIGNLLRRSGGALATLGALVQGICALWVASSQPEAVQTALGSSSLAQVSSFLYLGATAAVLALGLFLGTRKAGNLVLSWGGVVVAFLGTAGAVIYRDAIRDATLMGHGFDVWKRTEVSNWGVIAIFLLLFVIMLGVIFWLIQVMRQATPPQETVTP